MFDDVHRGSDTGFVGRADRWYFAWHAFLERPLTGRGLGSYAALDLDSLAQFLSLRPREMGLLSVPLFLMIIAMGLKAYRLHGWKVVSLVPVGVLMVMNDRFMNLNPYPFLLWVLLFALSTVPVPAARPVPANVRRQRPAPAGQPSFAGPGAGPHPGAPGP